MNDWILIIILLVCVVLMGMEADRNIFLNKRILSCTNINGILYCDASKWD